MRILGLTGPAGAGKDTAAEFVMEWALENDIYALRAGFADALKYSAAVALGMPPAVARGASLEFINALKERGTITVNIPRTEAEVALGLDGDEMIGFSGRQFLQWYGTEAHRDAFGTDFWVDALFSKYSESSDRPELLVIPDVRFLNEADAIHSRSGQIWGVHRPDAASVENHVSEAGLPDHVLRCSIRNEAALEDFRTAVFQTADALLKLK